MKYQDMKYQRVDILSYKEKMNDLLKEFEEAIDTSKRMKVFEEINAKRNEAWTMCYLCFIRYSIDTKDEFYMQEMEYVDETEPELQAVDSIVLGHFTQSAHREEIEAEMGSFYFEKIDYILKTYDDKIKDDLVEENKLCNEYNKLIASAEIEFEGEKRNLSELGPFKVSEDRKIREKANEAYFGFFAKNQEALDEIYDKLVKIRHKIATTLGYHNFVELGYVRMMRMGYDAKDVAIYRDEIRKYIVPLAVELRKQQQERLGYDTLCYYDHNYKYPSGNPKPQGTAEEIVTLGRNMYHELSKETGVFYDMMIDNGLVDLVAKKGKMGGGYCEYLPLYESPFVFSNFNGTLDDVTVLTHEMGHAFQAYMSRNVKNKELNMITYDMAEVHSMSMEFLTYPWMESFFKEDANKFKHYHLGDGISFIPYGVLVDHFQHEIYEKPDLTPKERHAVWRKLEKIYLPDVSYEGNDYLENGGFWQRQAHIYQDPFYYVDYTLAQICAYQFYVKDIENHETAWKDYVKVCEIAGKVNFVELVEVGGLESPFKKGTLEKLTNVVRKALDEIDDATF